MEKFGELKDKFKTAGEKIRGLEREKAALQKEKTALEKEKTALEEKRVTTALRHLKEVNRLRDSRSYKVTHERVRVQTAMIVKSNHRFAKIRDLEKRRGDFETADPCRAKFLERRSVLKRLRRVGLISHKRRSTCLLSRRRSSMLRLSA